jgi:hypothetical protein
MTTTMRRSTRWFAAFLAWLAFASVAWAGYDGRRAELRDKLALTQLAGDFERQKLVEAIDKYIAARNEGLTELVRVVEESGSSYTDQERKWLDRVATIRRDLATDIGDSLKDVPTPSVGGLGFRQIVFVEEDKFLNGLVAVKVAEARDQIVVNHKNVEEMTRVLDEKWSRLRADDQSFDDNEKRVVEDLKTLRDEAVTRVAWERRNFKDKLATAVQKLTGIPRPDTIPEWIEVPLQLLKEGSEWWLKTRDSFDVQRERYSGYVAGERGGILVLFKGIRDETQSFVEKNKFDQMKKRYEEARSKLDDWRSSTSTSGQRRDADAFGADVLAKLSSHLSATENVFNAFVRAHEYKFFGPVGPSVREELVKKKIWEDRVRMLEAQDLESRLREWRSDTDNWWLVDMSPLPSETREWLKGLIKDRVAQIVDAEERVRAWNLKIGATFDRRAIDDDVK